jgi:hypothetical protein
LPWDSFEPALRELRGVAKRRMLVSLPDITPYFMLYIDRGKDRSKFLRFRELPNPRAACRAFA